MMILSSFVEFVTTGGIGFLFLDWLTTFAALGIMFSFRDWHYCEPSERHYPWPKKWCAHCQKGEAS